jgi:hypothetical protein
MPAPPTCHCGIFLSIPHEHAPGLPKTGAPILALTAFGASPAEALKEVERLMAKGLLAKVGEGLYKITERGAKVAEEAEEAAALEGQAL